MNREQFIEKARKIHGDKYDYSKVNYINSQTKVCIICPEHGEFWQTPHSHLIKHGCCLCGKNKKNYKSTKLFFVEKARKIHGDKYNYSKVNYINNRTKVCIICPEHGEFWQTPSSHLSNRGCNKCSKPVNNTETFIEKAREVHGDKYDYSKVNYINNQTKVCIICHEKDNNGNEYGEFWQTPANHLSGKGCYRLSKDVNDKNKILSTEQFIEKAKKVHDDKYDYSKVSYINSKTPVCIICHRKDKNGNEHGEFWQMPNKHISEKEGCPKCNYSNLERDVENLLKQNNISYKKEFSPKWANKKRYDFCIEEKKILIECQGIQHYKSIEYFGGENEYKKRIKNDKKKKKLAKENGYKLIYYTEKKLKEKKEITDIETLKKLLMNEKI